MAPARDKWVRRFIIPETTRHKKGFTIYKVTSVVYLKASREEISKVSVWKRYNDFKKLYSALQALHTQFQIKEPFPSFPKSRFFGRFEAEVIQERKSSALKFLEFIGRHSCLYTSDIFIKFFETSHADNSINDCSQSIGSDTSEDDHHSNLNNSVIVNNFDSQEFYHNVSKTHDCLIHSHPILDDLFDRDKPISATENNVVPSNISAINNSQKSKIFICTNVTIPDIDKLNCPNDTSESNVSNLSIVSNGHSKHEEAMPDVTVQRTIHDGSDLPRSCEDTSQYILIAAAHMSAASQHEAISEYEEAFTQYKMGISTLSMGVESDPDDTRKAIIKEKISKYLDRAEKLYNRHLNCNVSILNKPISELKNYKVLNIIDSVMVVKHVNLNSVRVIKTIEKSLDSKENISNYILRGQVPYMVRLHACIETETTVFLILEYAKRGRLWDFVSANYKIYNDSSKPIKRESLGSLNSSNNSQITFKEILNYSNESLNKNVKTIQTQNFTGTNGMNVILENTKCVTSQNEEKACLKNKIYSDVSTSQLLEKAQKLLLSVNATLKRSNSVAARLNESKQLLYYEDRIAPQAVNQIPSSNELIENISTDTSHFKKEPYNATLLNQNNLNKCLSNSCIDFSFCDIQRKTESFDSTSSETLGNSITDDLKNESINDVHISLVSESLTSTMKNAQCMEIDKYINLNMEQALWKIPEDTVRLWAAEILLALEALHQQEVIVFNLKPENVLLDNSGHVQLTYVIPRRNIEFTKLRQPYSSPELYMFSPATSITPATDIWNFGVILYELLIGIKFKSLHPEPFLSHSMISVPNSLSDDAKSLLLNILKYEPQERLTIPQIKQHRFFKEIDWSNMLHSLI